MAIDHATGQQDSGACALMPTLLSSARQTEDAKNSGEPASMRKGTVQLLHRNHELSLLPQHLPKLVTLLKQLPPPNSPNSTKTFAGALESAAVQPLKTPLLVQTRCINLTTNL